MKAKAQEKFYYNVSELRLENLRECCGSVILSNGNLVIASGNGSFELWSLSKKKLLKTWQGHKGSVGCLIPLREGGFVSSGSESRQLKIWNGDGEWIKTLKPKKPEENEEDNISCICQPFLPQSQDQFLISGDDAGWLRLWNVTRGDCVQLWKNNKDFINIACVTAEGEYYSILKPSSEPRDYVSNIYALLSGEVIVTGPSDTNIWCLEGDVPKISFIWPDPSRSNRVELCYKNVFPEGKIVMEFLGCGLGLWDIHALFAKGKEEVNSPSLIKPVKENAIWWIDLQAYISYSNMINHHLVCGFNDGAIKVYELAVGKCIDGWSVDKESRAVSINSLRNGSLVTISDHGTINIHGLLSFVEMRKNARIIGQAQPTRTNTSFFSKLHTD